MRKFYIFFIALFSVFVFIIGLIFGSVIPIMGEHSRHNDVDVIYVEKPMEIVKYVEVPLDKYENGMALYNTSIRIGDFSLYQRYYGNCNLSYETIIYENEDFYWKINIQGCESQDKQSSNFFLEVNCNYISINKAIIQGYISLSDLSHLDTIKKINKNYNKEES